MGYQFQLLQDVRIVLNEGGMFYNQKSMVFTNYLDMGEVCSMFLENGTAY